VKVLVPLQHDVLQICMHLHPFAEQCLISLKLHQQVVVFDTKLCKLLHIHLLEHPWRLFRVLD
jgi:hypothetical protein